MAPLLTAADFRKSSLDEVCSGLELTDTEAKTAMLTSAIDRMTTAFGDLCNDRFTSSALTLTLDGSGGFKLYLPHRCTAIASVTANTTLQSVGVYALHSSLDAAGATREGGEFDWISILPNPAVGLSLLNGYTPWRWPLGTQNISVVGNFGYLVPPPQARRAVALMVWNHFKPQSSSFGNIASYRTSDTEYLVAPQDPDHPTGLPEVDAIYQNLRRDTEWGIG